MQQAYTNFNAGKYKEALSFLNSNHQNYQSFQPNVAVCQYLTNRSNQSALNCLKRLTDILNKKQINEEDTIQIRSDQIIKYNISIILNILGKKNYALTTMSELYRQRQCFIEYVQCRILFILMQLELCLKNNTEALILLQGFPNKPVASKAPVTQWISIILHEHSKASGVVSQQFYFIAQVLLSQAIMGLGLPETSMPKLDELENKKLALIQRFKKRKNNLNKYYQVNLIMIDRFLVAQRYLHEENIIQCLAFLNLSNIQQQYQTVPISKPALNIYNSLSISNVALVHFHLNKKSLALHFFKKAREHLLKTFTADDRDLHLIAINYANHSERISENIALSLLNVNHEQAYILYDSIFKSNKGITNYKCWYRLGQATLSYYHSLCPQIAQKNINLLQSAYTAFSNAQLCLKNWKLPTFKLIRYYKFIKEEDLEATIAKTEKQIAVFRTSIMLFIGYTSLGLGAYHRTIQVCQSIIKLKDNSQSRFYAWSYLIQAYIKTGRLNDARNVLKQAQKEIIKDQNGVISVFIENNNKNQIGNYHKRLILAYQMCLLLINQDRIFEAYNIAGSIFQSGPEFKLPKLIQLLMHYLNTRISLHKAPYIN